MINFFVLRGGRGGPPHFFTTYRQCSYFSWREISTFIGKPGGGGGEACLAALC